MGDFVVVREGVPESRTLGFAEGGEGWVGQGVVGCAEVVVPLGVADEVDYGLGWHLDDVDVVDGEVGVRWDCLDVEVKMVCGEVLKALGDMWIGW